MRDARSTETDTHARSIALSSLVSGHNHNHTSPRTVVCHEFGILSRTSAVSNSAQVRSSIVAEFNSSFLGRQPSDLIM